MKYTVILIYPDYIGGYGEEFYTAHVEALSPEHALFAARTTAVQANGGSLDPESDDYMDPVDFACVAVYEGDLENLNPE